MLVIQMMSRGDDNDDDDEYKDELRYYYGMGVWPSRHGYDDG
jgi:hypothetical protein